MPPKTKKALELYMQ